MTDITEPKRIREQLSASYERFTTVLEALDASVSVAPLGSEELLFANKLYRLWFGSDTDGHLQWWRRRACRLRRAPTKGSTRSTRSRACPIEQLTAAQPGNTRSSCRNSASGSKCVRAT